MKLILFAMACLLHTGMTLQAQKMTVASYNIRLYSKGDSIKGDGWEQRSPALCQLIAYHDFDIFGTQEGYRHQLEDMVTRMPNYAYIGVGREDGKQVGEYSAVFYKKDKFKLLDQGNFWISADPSKPNLGWDAACIRICSWGKFQDVKTGFKFLLFNVHMDHIGVIARKEGAKLILKKIKEMSGNNPTILTGDFNVNQHDESYTLLNTSGILRDSYELSPIQYAMNGTFNGFKTNEKTEERIDHIFLSKEFKVSRYGILTDVYWSPVEGKPGQFQSRIPSDHYPVVIHVNK